MRLINDHWHTDAVHIGITTLGVFVTAWAIRLVAARAAAAGDPNISNIGKAVGGFFSLPAAG